MSFVLRAIRPSDLEAVHRLNRRIEEWDRIPIATPRVEFEQWLREPHFDLTRDARLAEIAGEVVGWGRIWHPPSGEREERAYLPGGVDPAHRRAGIGSALLAWQIERAGDRLRSATAVLPRYVRVTAYESQHSAQRLYARHGLVAVRYGDELVRDLKSVAEPPPIAGIEIVPWDPHRSEDARLAQNDAFADHWGSTPRGPATWEHDLTSHGARLDLSFLALDGERVVGVCRNGHFPDDEMVTGRRDGWIMQVGVVRSHRKRGIATALIGSSLVAFRAAGYTHTALAVDSENPTGAYRLYERLGYRRVRRSIVYQLEVGDAGGP